MSEQAKAENFGDGAIAALNQHCQRMLKHEQAVYQDEDPEALHQMRVGMRRIRSALVGFSLAIEIPKAAKEKKVGKIARKLGTLRDLDVLKETLETDYLPQLPVAEQDNLNQVFQELGKQRKKAYQTVKKTLESQAYQDLKTGLTGWLEKPELSAIAPLPIAEVLPDLLLPQVSHLLLHPGWFVQKTEQESVTRILAEKGETLHDLRKVAKKARYQMELFTDCYDQTYGQYVKDIKAIQNVLGKIQDNLVLTEFLTHCMGDTLSQEFPQLLQQISQLQEQKWQEWEQLQQQFLDPSTRQNLRLTVQNPFPETESHVANHESLAIG
ncbi:MAG: CHAD domain-containing protein [Halothece sp.]